MKAGFLDSIKPVTVLEQKEALGGDQSDKSDEEDVALQQLTVQRLITERC